MALQITITDAGRAEIINAENTGTGPVVISQIGFGTGQYTPSKTQTALQSEVTRVDTIGGQAVAADTVHVTAKDEGSDAYNVGEFGLFSASGTLIAVYSQLAGAGWILQKASASTLLLAVDIVLESLDADTLSFGDVVFVNPPATTEVVGVVELATSTETQIGSDGSRAVTPAGLKSLTATDTRAGLVELATSGETQTGSDSSRAVTPAGLKSLTASTVRAGLVQLNDTLTSASTLQALTAAAGKKLQDEKQPLLGFTPVQQGGGAGQGNSKIHIGWSADGLRLQVDLTDFAITWPISVGGNSESATKLKTARTINGVAFDGSANITVYDATKAPLVSPALGGTPTTPTAAAGNNTTQIANTAFVQAAIAALVNSSPAALDTLNELAIALGNDPNFAVTVTNALAGKVNRDSITDAGFAGGDTNYPYFRAAVDGVVHYLQKALGFTPVRQGGGANQLTNTVYIGFDGTDLRAQVDLTDFGQLWSDHNGPQKIGAMAVGSVGSYALCIVGGGAVDVAVTAGTLVAGSNLRYAAASGGFSGTPSGTWRVMGHLYDANLNDTNSVTLCLRVS